MDGPTRDDEAPPGRFTANMPQRYLFNFERYAARGETQRGPDDDRQLEEMLREASSGITAGQFSPEPGFHCTFCDYRPICPAHEQKG